MADLKAKLTLNDKNFTAKLDSACKRAQTQLQNVSKSAGLLGGNIGGAAGKISGLIGGFGRLAGPMAAATASMAALGAGLQSVIENSAKFDLALDHLQALTGLTGDQMKNVKDQILETANAIHVGASQVADAYGIVGSKMPELLQNTQALDQVVRAASTLGKAGLMPLEEAISALTNIMNQMGLDANQASSVINVLAAGSKNGAGNIQYLSEAFTKAGTTMKMAGISIEEGTAAIEVLSKKIPDSAVAGTRLNKVLLALETQSDKNLKPSLVGLHEALKNLGKISGDTTAMTKMFGTANYTAAKILADEAEQIGVLTNKVTDTNEAEQQAAINTDNVSGRVAALKASWENLTSAFSESTGVIASLIGYLDQAIQKFRILIGLRNDFEGIEFDYKKDDAPQKDYLMNKYTKQGLSEKEAEKKVTRDLYNDNVSFLKNDKERLETEKEKVKTLQKQKDISQKTADRNFDDFKAGKISKKVWEKSYNYNEAIGKQLKDAEHNVKLYTKQVQKHEQAVSQYGKELGIVTDSKPPVPPVLPAAPAKPGRGGSGRSEPEAAAGSLKALEKELSDYQNKFQKGLLPEVSVDEYLGEVKRLQGLISKERIRLKIDPDPESLAGLRKTLQDIDNQIVTLEPGVDPSALLKSREEIQKKIDNLEVSYKIKPYIAPDSLQKMQEDFQEWLDKVQRGEINLTAEEFQTQKKQKETAIKDKENEIGFSTNLQDIEKEFKEFQENLGRKSSFEIALGEQQPQTLDEQLSQYQDLMGQQDDLINKLKERMKAEKDGTKAGEEAAAKTQEALNAAVQKQNEYAAAVQRTAEQKKKLEEQEKTWQQAAGAINDFGASLSNLGSAFELPALNIAGVIAQSVANMALGFAQASMQEGKKGIWFWLAASMAGLAQLTAMIAQIHSITGYSQGGIVGGGKSVGDKNIIGVNSGEVILNKNQQARLWRLLDGQSKLSNDSNRGGQVQFVLRGSDLYGSFNNYKKITKK